MAKIQNLLRGINPLDTQFYFDKIRIWSKQPLSPRDQRFLQQHCGPGGLHVEQQQPRFGWYRHMIDIHQPTRPALQLLAQLPDDVLLNYAEVTIDLTMPDAASKYELLDMFQHGFLQSWHRDRQVESYSTGGFSTRETPEEGERRVGSWFQWYVDRHCKLTGEVDCFHFEGKYEGVQAVRRIGIQHPRDLLDFDFDAYFAKYLRLHQIDLERLGRYDHNRVSGAKRKRANISRHGKHVFNWDRLRGGMLYRLMARHPGQPEYSLQQFVDQYGRGPFLTPMHYYVHVRQAVTSHLTGADQRHPKDFGDQHPDLANPAVSRRKSTTDNGVIP